ncbi:MAG: FAD binding domain-containing protein [Acidimicrobiia bacterium]
MRGFEYERPTSLDEAVQLLDERGEEAHLLAGGTDLAVAIRYGTVRPGVVIDLKQVPELAAAMRHTDEGFTISANTVMTDLEEDARIRERFPGLVEAAQVVGSVQIRNRATLVGNLCNASPAADTPPMLMALDTSVEISGPRGSRSLSIDEFLVGYRETALQRGEVLTAVHIPEPGPRSGTAFLKLGVRRAMEISIVCVGARIDLAEDGTIASAGLGLGSVAPQTVRPTRAEELLVGERPDPELLAAAGSSATEACSPIDDLRGSAEYRRAMVPVLVRRALSAALGRAGKGR